MALKTITLRSVDKAKLQAELASIPYQDGDNREGFMRSAHKRMVKRLPDSVTAALDNMKDTPIPPGALLIRNMPIDDPLPNTPADGRWKLSLRTPVAEAAILGVGRFLGLPYSFFVEKGPDLVHNVVPVRGKEQDLTNMGSKQEIGFHTELAYFPQPPRWIILFCLRADHECVAQTPIADIRDALAVLDPQHAAELRKPLFRVRCPFIFDPLFAPEQRYSSLRPVLTGPDHSPDIRVALYGDLTQAETEEGRQALLALDAAVRKTATYIKLVPGDMVILSNYVVLHARTSFTPRFDGLDRWLLRIHVADSLWPLRDWQERSPRVLCR